MKQNCSINYPYSNLASPLESTIKHLPLLLTKSTLILVPVCYKIHHKIKKYIYDHQQTHEIQIKKVPIFDNFLKNQEMGILNLNLQIGNLGKVKNEIGDDYNRYIKLYIYNRCESE